MRHARTTSMLAMPLLAAGLVACSGSGPGAGQGPDDPQAADADGADEEGEPDEEPADEEPADDAEVLVADVVGVDGTEHGEVTFTAVDGGVLVEATLEGFDGPGFHGFHLHEVGRCDADAPEGPFDSADGHLGGDADDHSAHAGDLTALQVTDDGRARLQVRTTGVGFEELAAADAALIVHADPDNFGHIPSRYVLEDTEEAGPDEDSLDTGDAGDRIACGVLLAPQGD